MRAHIDSLRASGLTQLDYVTVKTILISLISSVAPESVQLESRIPNEAASGSGLVRQLDSSNLSVETNGE